MALLTQLQSNRAIAPRARSLIGRSRACDLVLADRRVSAEHAVLFLDPDGRWAIRDLGSRNGTWIERERLETGQVRRVEVGEVLSFGSQENQWRLRSTAPPGPYAIGDDPVAPLGHSEGFLLLPDEEDPAFCVMPSDDGWQIEGPDGVRAAARDGQIVEAPTGRWRLVLPLETDEHYLSATLQGGAPPSLDELSLEIEHSLDEEYIRVAWRHGGRRVPLRARAFHELVLVLARARLSDRADGIDEAECGWMHVEDLGREVGAVPRKINVDVLRCRRQLSETGVRGANRLFERRKTTRQLRLGAAAVSVRRLGS